MNIASLNPEFVFCAHMKCASVSLHKSRRWSCFCLHSNGHLDLKRGHILYSRCSH